MADDAVKQAQEAAAEAAAAATALQAQAEEAMRRAAEAAALAKAAAEAAAATATATEAAAQAAPEAAAPAEPERPPALETPTAPAAATSGPLDESQVDVIRAGYALEGAALEIGALVNGEALPDVPVRIPLAMTNRHGLVAGA